MIQFQNFHLFLVIINHLRRQVFLAIFRFTLDLLNLSLKLLLERLLLDLELNLFLMEYLFKVLLLLIHLLLQFVLLIFELILLLIQLKSPLVEIFEDTRLQILSFQYELLLIFILLFKMLIELIDLIFQSLYFLLLIHDLLFKLDHPLAFALKVLKLFVFHYLDLALQIADDPLILRADLFDAVRLLVILDLSYHVRFVLSDTLHLLV